MRDVIAEMYVVVQMNLGPSGPFKCRMSQIPMIPKPGIDIFVSSSFTCPASGHNRGRILLTSYQWLLSAYVQY